MSGNVSFDEIQYSAGVPIERQADRYALRAVHQLKPLSVQSYLIARPEFQGQGGEEGGDHVRYFVTIGKRDGITVKELVTFIHETTGIPGNRIGDITFLEKFSFVNVPSGFADKFADSLAGSRLKGRRVNVERANASRPSGNNRRR